MKVIIGFIPMQFLYWFGGLISHVNWKIQWPYRVYNFCMVSSMRIQDWMGPKEYLWHTPK